STLAPTTPPPPQTMPEPAASTSATEAAFRYRVSGMDCGNCALTIEQSVRQLEGIEDVRVSFATGTLEGSGSVSRDALAARVEALGYRLADDAAPDAPALDRRGLAGFVRFLWRTPPLRVAALLGLAVLATVPLQAAATHPNALLAIEAIRWLA